MEGQTKFENPEQELEFLREQVAIKEKALESRGEKADRAKIVSEEIKNYQKSTTKDVLHKDFALPKAEVEAIVLDLSPEQHDSKMEELVSIVEEKGVMNVFSILEKLQDSHLDDDFHRFLVQYVKAGFSVLGVKEKSPLFKALRMTLFEVSLPDTGENKEKSLKEVLSVMEQFYAGMLSVSDEQKRDEGYFSLEFANANHSEEFIFYVSVPDSKRSLFEKQILSVYPNAKLLEQKDDYNIFNESGISLASFVRSTKNPIFPIKTYDKFDYDPLNIIANSFSKIDRDGEGASIQVIFKPAGDYFVKAYEKALHDIEKGAKVKEAIDIAHTFGGTFKKAIKELFAPSKFPNKDKTPTPLDQNVLENIKNKIQSPIALVNIRIVASSGSREEALAIISDIESSFNQFENTTGNRLSFERAEKRKLNKTLHDFSYRLWDDDIAIPLNLREISTLMHFPGSPLKSSSQVKISKAGTAPAPVGMLSSGTLLGVNRNRGMETKIFISPDDRLRHFYTIGQTGTGKTTLLKNMIVQDILAGNGVCMIDPHGSDIQDILASIPENRWNDVIYFDPGYTERPMALNMLEYDVRFPEQKTFVVNEMLSIFDKLFDMKTAGGPMFEQYFRNSVMLAIEDPDSGNTLLDVSRVLANKAFREMKISKCKNPIVVQFWKEVAEKAGGEASLANIVPYITSKFDNFLSNDIMRPIIAQEKSTFNFRQIMDEKKILLVNLSKGRLGDINSNLIGLIVVGKILMASLSRVDSLGKDLPPFYLYIDEFQNITTNSIATILSEARKYKLSLNIAHQFIGQLDEKIKNAVFGNVGSLAVFRVGADDAEYLVKQFEPVFTANDLINLDNRNAYLKLLVNGRPVKPFNIETLPPPKGDKENTESLKKLSYEKYGRARAEVEAEIMKKYEKKDPLISKI